MTRRWSSRPATLQWSWTRRQVPSTRPRLPWRVPAKPLRARPRRQATRPEALPRKQSTCWKARPKRQATRLKARPRPRAMRLKVRPRPRATRLKVRPRPRAMRLKARARPRKRWKPKRKRWKPKSCPSSLSSDPRRGIPRASGAAVFRGGGPAPFRNFARSDGLGGRKRRSAMAKDPDDSREPRETGYTRVSDRGMKWPLIIAAAIVLLVLLAWAGSYDDGGGWLLREDATDADATPNVDADVTPSDPVE